MKKMIPFLAAALLFGTFGQAQSGETDQHAAEVAIDTGRSAASANPIIGPQDPRRAWFEQTISDLLEGPAPAGGRDGWGH